MHPQWRIVFGAAVSASVAAVLGWGQPWLTRAAHAFSWEGIGCGSADGGDEVWMASGWVVWWTAGAVAIAVIAGARVAGSIDRNRHPWVYAVLAVAAVAAAPGALLAALGRLTARAGDPSCHSGGDYTGEVTTGVALAVGMVAVVAVLAETAFAVVAGWAWMWVLNGHTYLRYLLGDDGLQHVGDTEGTGNNGVFHALSIGELVTGTAVLVGYLGVLPVLVWWHAYRRGRRDGVMRPGERALVGVFVLHLPVFVGLATR